MAEESKVLVARGVGKVYRTGGREIPALADVDLEVPRAAFVSVVGPSGSGKTTLLHCLSGLDDVDSGYVEVEGEDVHRLPEAQRAAQRARLMGFVFQSLNLLPVLSVAENVELPLMLRNGSAKEARGAALAALERVGLSDVGDRRPGELSGGERQRVAVARALAARPAIVWADEPTGNLDSAAAGLVADLLGEINADGTTLVLVTHDKDLAEMAGRRISMRDGRIIEDTG
jgi:putative ABC transport system ATP-binding protein